MAQGQPKPQQFWAKLERDSSPPYTTLSWHSLLDHCADVGACAEALLESTILSKRLACLANLTELSHGQRARLCVLISLHDAGKANHGFQNRAYGHLRPQNGHLSPIIDALLAASHDEASLAWALLVDDLDLGPINEWFYGEDERPGCGGLEHILLTVWAHHGRPVSARDNFSALLWSPNAMRDPRQELRRLRRAVEEWFPAAFEAGIEPLACGAGFEHALSGLTSLADWLGSDPNFFPFTTPTAQPRIEWARERAKELCSSIGLHTAHARAQLHAPIPFSQLSPHPSPRPAQQIVADVPQASQGSLLILEAETGAGKTEAALWRYLQLFERGLVDGLYFALPTRAAATQLFERVVKIISLAFGHDNPHKPPVTLALPGYLRVDDRHGTQLTRFDVRWDEEQRADERWHRRGWAAESPTRFLAGAIVVGTIDQVLMSTLQVRYSHLRASALLRHLLVVDEVHASDTYMGRLLEHVLAFHTSAQGHAMLMSATLGSALRERLLRAPALPLDQARTLPYPLVSWRAPSRSPVERSPSPADTNIKAVHLKLLPWMEQDQQQLVETIWRQACDGARVLVIRSTVMACTSLQLALEQLAQEQDPATWPSRFLCVNNHPCPHHSRYSPEDRRCLDLAVEAALHPESKQTPGIIIVATQTVEQSLDIDADILWTDLCPMDVLLQRVGRLHRHKKRDPYRPKHAQAAQLFVLTPQSRDLTALITPQKNARGPCGIGTVYDNLLILEATWRCLESRPSITIPQDNRELVELTTHPEALEAIIAQDPQAWQPHQHYLLGQGFAHSQLANLNTVLRQNPYSSSYTASSEAPHAIQTRLGTHDRVVFFPEGTQGPFGESISRITVPEHLARELSDEPQLTITQMALGVLEFTLDLHPYRYDRLGLQRLS